LLWLEVSGRYTGVGDRRLTCYGSASQATATSGRRTTPVPQLELNVAPTAEDMPDIAIALIRAIIAAADKDRDEMTVLLIQGSRRR
jgi:hypothetical protein